MEYVALGMKTKKALELVKLSAHQYYYRNKTGKVGRPSSTLTVQKTGEQTSEVSNQVVMEKMEENHVYPDLSYCYRRMTSYLQLLGLFINHKKVYRLMK